MKQSKNKKNGQRHLVGIPGIDEQHDDLIKRITNIICQLKKKDPSLESLSESFTELGHTIKAHFNTEENLMNMIGFPALAIHQKEHAKLGKQLSEATKAAKKSDFAEAKDILAGFYDDGVEHAAAFDIEIASHIEELMTLRQKYNITAVKAQILAK